MKPLTLTACGEQPQCDRLQRLVDAICKAWPERSAVPKAEFRGTEFIDSVSEDDPGVGLVIVDFQGLTGRELHKAIDRLRMAQAFGVVLVRLDQADVPASSEGLIIHDAATDPTLLAVTLHAVSICGESVDALRRELRISQKTSGGVREEISRISQELSLASRIQQELVPKQLPETDGIDFGVLYRPASYVSGDIYNAARIDDRRAAFFIADAVGHGVPAALLTMIISRSLPMRPASAADSFTTPAEALAKLNEELCDVGDGTPRFATAVYGVIDTVSGLVRIANGGHPQPMRITSDRVEKVEAGGPLLGVFRGAAFEEEVFTLEPAETLLLYSDGFETAFPDADAVLQGGVPSPSNRYLDQLLNVGRRKRASCRSVDDALRILEQKLDEAQGSLHQIDDVTALALERTAA